VIETCNPTQVAEIRKIMVWSQPRQIVRPYLKIPNTKKGGGVAQVVVCMPSNCEALSSNPRDAKKKKNAAVICHSGLLLSKMSPTVDWFMEGGAGKDLQCLWITTNRALLDPELTRIVQPQNGREKFLRTSCTMTFESTFNKKLWFNPRHIFSAFTAE
jgi:hypothetical protein